MIFKRLGCGAVPRQNMIETIMVLLSSNKRAMAVETGIHFRLSRARVLAA